MNASKYRDTQFEIMSFAQGANSFAVRATARDGSGVVELEIGESSFTDAEMSVVHGALEILELKSAAVYAAHQAKPEDLKAVINEAAAAKTALEAMRAEAATLEAEMARVRAEAGIVP